MSEAQSIEARRAEGRRSVAKLTPEARLERVVDRLGQLAEEFPQAMTWVQAEVEAMRSEVRTTLKAAAQRSAAESELLSKQLLLLRESVAAMEAALVALRDEVSGATVPIPPHRSAPRSPTDPAPGRTGLGLPPRRSANPFPDGGQPPHRRS